MIKGEKLGMYTRVNCVDHLKNLLHKIPSNDSGLHQNCQSAFMIACLGTQQDQVCQQGVECAHKHRQCDNNHKNWMFKVKKINIKPNSV
jgi:hypothetical protein